MASKQEIEEEINEKLDTDLEWSRMTKDDLVDLVEMIDDMTLLEKLLKLSAKDVSKKQMDKLVESWYPGKYAKGVL